MHLVITIDMLLQDILADTVQDAFKDLVYIMQGDLYQSMPAFLADNDNDNEAGKDFRLLFTTLLSSTCFKSDFL